MCFIYQVNLSVMITQTWAATNATSGYLATNALN